MTTQEITSWLRQYNRPASWLANELQISDRTLHSILTGEISPKIQWKIKKLQELDRLRQTIPANPLVSLPISLTPTQLDKLAELASKDQQPITGYLHEIIIDHLDQAARQNSNE